MALRETLHRIATSLLGTNGPARPDPSEFGPEAHRSREALARLKAREMQLELIKSRTRRGMGF